MQLIYFFFFATNSFWFRSITEMKLLKFTSISGFDAPLLVFKTIG